MRTRFRRGRFAVIALPYAWLLAFFLLPFLVVAKISVSEMETTTFKDLVSWKDGARRPKTQQLHNLAGAGALGGAFWGLLFGLLFFVPLWFLGSRVVLVSGFLRDQQNLLAVL